VQASEWRPTTDNTPLSLHGRTAVEDERERPRQAAVAGGKGAAATRGEGRGAVRADEIRF